VEDSILGSRQALVSLKHRFLFIHVPKTGGNSIQDVLRLYSEDQIVRLTPLQDGIERFEVRNPNYSYQKHSSLKEYAAMLDPHLFASLYKFTCIRNPWERMISFYFSPHRQVTRWNRDDFIRFIEEVPPMLSYLDQRESSFTDSSSAPSLGVHRVLRFERLQDDFNLVCDDLGIKRQMLPHRNASPRRHLSEYYDPTLIELVARRCAADIEYFGFRFEGK
jgi:hypothetical protein